MGCGASKEKPTAAEKVLEKELKEKFDKKGKCSIACLGDRDYVSAAYQYASTSYAPTHDTIPASMSPLAVIKPAGPAANADQFVAEAIKWAAANKYKVAVRTGGHSYCGSSSGNRGVIQLDLIEAYTEHTWDDATGLFTTGTSLSLGELNGALAQCKTGADGSIGCFLPTGQCCWVHLGGHMQTGGIGQLCRAYGLIIDYIQEFTVFTADGNKTVAKPDDELFRACLGQSFGGNYGIVTNVVFKPLQNKDHKYSRAGRWVLPYTKGADRETLEAIFTLIAQWKDAPGDYDFSMSLGAMEDAYSNNVLAPKLATFDSRENVAGLDNLMHRLFQPGGQALVLYFQYSNRSGSPDDYDDQWYRKIVAAVDGIQDRIAANPELQAKKEMANKMLADVSADVLTPMSSCVKLWTYMGKREYNYPYIKCCQYADELVDPVEFPKRLAALCDEAAQPGLPQPWIMDPKFKALFTDMVDDLKHGKIAGAFKDLLELVTPFFEKDPDTKLMVFTQWQNFGGPDSANVTNAPKVTTTYNWRTTATIGGDLGYFFNPKQAGAEDEAKKYHAQTLALLTGEGNLFCKKNIRSVAFPHDTEAGIEVDHPMYFEPDNWKFANEFKAKIDPNFIFSPNPNSIGWAKAEKTADVAPEEPLSLTTEGLYSCDAGMCKDEHVIGAVRHKERVGYVE